MKVLWLWFLYYPFRCFIAMIPPAFALRIADALGDLEYIALGRRNVRLTAFMARILSRTDWEGRIEELKRKNLRFRYRNFVARNLQASQKLHSPTLKSSLLQEFSGKGVCFPVCHFGYFFLGFGALARAVGGPVFTISMMKGGSNALEDKCIALKKEMIRSLGTVPVFDLSSFKRDCLPTLVAATGGYVPTFDAVTSRAKLYPLLGGEVVLSLEATARYILDNRLPVVPFFVVGEDFRSALVELAPAFVPAKGEATQERFEAWYLEVLEDYVLHHAEVVDWFFWWKNVNRFKARSM